MGSFGILKNKTCIGFSANAKNPTVSVKSLAGSLNRLREKPFAIVVDGTVNSGIIDSAEEVGCEVIAAKNFTTSDSKLKLLSL